MTSIEHLNLTETPLCEAVICALSTVRADFPVQAVQQQLDLLVQEARQYVACEAAADMQLERLLELFYHQWGFRCASGVYNLSDALWLDKVLQTRQGTAVSLGVILLHITGELEIPLMPVIFPTQLILRADWFDGDKWLINPLNGETLDEHTLEVWLKGDISPDACLYEDDLDQAKPRAVIQKILDSLKAALMEEKQMEMALNANRVLLLLYPDDPYEIRDRGLIYAQLECEHIALSDLSYFVKHCPEDPISEIIQIQINAIKQKQVTLH